MIRVILPSHLKTLARVDGEITINVQDPVTLGSVLDVLEVRYPALRGTIRDHVTKKKRPLVRFYACERDFSHEPSDALLPETVMAGKDPFIILGAIAGG